MPETSWDPGSKPVTLGLRAMAGIKPTGATKRNWTKVLAGLFYFLTAFISVSYTSLSNSGNCLSSSAGS